MSNQLTSWHKFLITFHFNRWLLLFYLSICFYLFFFFILFIYFFFVMNKLLSTLHMLSIIGLFTYMHSLSTACHRLWVSSYLVFGKSINFWYIGWTNSLSDYHWFIIKRVFYYYYFDLFIYFLFFCIVYTVWLYV